MPVIQNFDTAFAVTRVKHLNQQQGAAEMRRLNTLSRYADKS